MGTILLTLAVGAACGLLLLRLKVPGGMIVGAIIGTAALNIGFEAAYMPGIAKTIAQITAGSFIGCTVTREVVRRLPRLLKPLLILLSGYLVLNLAVGFLVYRISGEDLVTCLMSCVPGGMSDIPIIAADMGASVPKVAVLQFVRMSVGIGVFPAMIVKAAGVDRQAPAADTGSAEAPSGTAAAPAGTAGRGAADRGAAVILATVAVGTVFGFLGKSLGIPAGTILFATVSVLIFKLALGKAYIPLWLKRVAQVLTGSYIGCCFGRQELAELRYLVLPAVVLLAGYFANCFLMGRLLPRVTHLNRAEAMLIATPAGASDMALISSDVGIDNPDVAFIQVLRMILVIVIFPHVVNLVVHLAG